MVFFCLLIVSLTDIYKTPVHFYLLKHYDTFKNSTFFY